MTTHLLIIEAYLRRNPDNCFIAKTGETITGAILSGHDGRRGYIYHLAVRKEARRQGIGGALVSHALAALKTQGIRKVALVVFSDNQQGNAFWERQGFEARADLAYRNRLL